jgi:uncharacterized membrane protein/Zn-finger nucleic acid-binding protein
VSSGKDYAKKRLKELERRSMKIHCPHCGVKGSADDSYSGRKVKCPQCSNIFEARQARAKDLPAESTPATEPASEAEFLRGEEVFSGMAGSGSGIDPDITGEDVVEVDEESLEDSLRCPHCGVKGSADDSYKGQKVKCPKCSGVFIVKGARGQYLPAEPVPVTGLSPETDFPAVQEQSLGWADIASEIDLDETGGEAAAEEEILEGASPGLNALLDDFEESAEEPSALTPTENVEQNREAESGPSDSMDFSQLEEISVIEEEDEPAEPPDEIEQEPYGIDTEQCWQCGKKDSVGESFIAKDGRLYCADCLPDEELYETGRAESAPHSAFRDDAGREPNYAFSIKETLREAWEKTKGAKGAIWAGTACMYLVILIIAVGGTYLLPSQSAEITDLSQLDIAGMASSAVLQMVVDVAFALFVAGLLFIGIRKVAGDPVSWKMTFKGFSCSGKIIVAAILQTLLISIGFLLLILPGIYLAIGYSMTMPLIVDKGLSPWQALETSRKAIHKVWWKVAGLLVVMGLLFVVALIPVGIGLIWVWPMFIVLGGVVYRHLFGVELQSD